MALSRHTFPQDFHPPGINGGQALHHRGVVQLVFENVHDQLGLRDVPGPVGGADPQVELVHIGVLIRGQGGFEEHLASRRGETE